MAYVRSQDCIAIGCASTALAATVYDDFMTTHSLFGIPVLEEEEYETIQNIQIELTPERKSLIHSASLIVWDEAFSNHSSCLTMVLHNFFQNIEDSDAVPKVLLLVGDNKQIAPVVKNAGKQQIIDASIISHEEFPKFVIHRFTRNLRLLCTNNSEFQSFENYARMLLEVGMGDINIAASPLSDIDKSTSSQNIHIPCLSATSDLGCALQFIHPSNSILDIDFPKRCILAGMHMLRITYIIELIAITVTNEQVEEWNRMIQDSMNTNDIRTYLSRDSYDSVDDPHGYLEQTLRNPEILNSLDWNDIPKHQLHLKDGDICLLMRNIAHDEGLTRNSRVRIIGLYDNTVRVKKLSTGKEYTIHRITFKHKLPFGRSFSMLRNQLPLTLAYAMTINKSQGQEFQKVLCDLRRPCFTHGHLYVALSRIRRPQDILVFAERDQIEENSIRETKNVVYKELIFDN